LILIGIGANLPSPRHGEPRQTCEAALDAMAGAGIGIAARSRWYRSAPVPKSSQPWYVNGVVAADTALAPAPLMMRLREIETDFGRTRGKANEARILDLDILAYGGMVSSGSGGGVVLPHPRLHERAFVLLPMRELAPDWLHPETGRTIDDLIAALPQDQIAEPLGD
jgi:2-amino-4-hydroxy-6-hydroxymethyldihydropteridine diphosphokinase